MNQQQENPPIPVPSGLQVGPVFRKVFNISTDWFDPTDWLKENLRDRDPSSFSMAVAANPDLVPGRVVKLGPDAVIEPMDKNFSQFFQDHWSWQGSKPQIPPADLLALLDELVAMALPLTALTLSHLEPGLQDVHGFAPQLAIGIASMMVRDFSTSEAALRKAQALIPEEPAPYVNLIQIFLETNRHQDADVWLDAGLEAAPNHHPLWELLYHRLAPVHDEFTPEKILEEARSRGSWAGVSLATSLLSTGDRNLKARELERFYNLGERDPLFLIELTGAYGLSEEFEKIPPIVWQAQKMTSKIIPWQLHAHGAQAEAYLGSQLKAKAHIELARKDRFISSEGLLALEELETELASH